MAKTDLPASLAQRIEDQIKATDVVLFMKGTATFPQCGFSARVVQVLNQLGVKYQAVNVLADQELREGIKVYSDWPTIPQLYIKGELIGGSDIVAELYQSGELQKKLGVAS
ncbi:Grx4 family monothiol glutaredoxin [Myxococcota bacterium]|nr:Grx4 family monothiol glutaredoxin [Myxococcota bacterium]